MPTGKCPDCDGEVEVESGTDLGEIVHCENCGLELEVVSLSPFVLDATAEYEEYEDEDDEDEY